MPCFSPSARAGVSARFSPATRGAGASLEEGAGGWAIAAAREVDAHGRESCTCGCSGDPRLALAAAISRQPTSGARDGRTRREKLKRSVRLYHVIAVCLTLLSLAGSRTEGMRLIPATEGA